MFFNAVELVAMPAHRHGIDKGRTEGGGICIREQPLRATPTLAQGQLEERRLEQVAANRLKSLARLGSSHV